MPRRNCVQCGQRAERLYGNHSTTCDACFVRQAGRPCSGCGTPAHGKARVRMGNGLEGFFCQDCAPVAREAARLRNETNRRRWGRAVAYGRAA